MSDINKQVDEAFSYRGHVTLTLKNGESVEGFLYNRELDNPKAAEQNFVEIVLKNSDVKKKFKIDELAKIELTGKNHAEAHNDFMKRTGGKS